MIVLDTPALFKVLTHLENGPEFKEHDDVLYLDLITLTILLPRNGPLGLLCYKRQYSLTAFKRTSRFLPLPDTSRVSGVLGRARHTNHDL